MAEELKNLISDSIPKVFRDFVGFIIPGLLFIFLGHYFNQQIVIDASNTFVKLPRWEKFLAEITVIYTLGRVIYLIGDFFVGLIVFITKNLREKGFKKIQSFNEGIFNNFFSFGLPKPLPTSKTASAEIFNYCESKKIISEHLERNVISLFFHVGLFGVFAISFFIYSRYFVFLAIFFLFSSFKQLTDLDRLHWDIKHAMEKESIPRIAVTTM